MTGDSIDNVREFREAKTASALIQKFGDLDKLYASLDQVPTCGHSRGRKVACLAEYRAQVELARKLVRIEIDMPLDVAPDDANGRIDDAAAVDLMRDLEFTSMVLESAPPRPNCR